MLRTPRSTRTASASASAARRALANGPRLSPTRQKRLEALLDKSHNASLSPKESSELEAMLEEIDRKSFWKVARALVECRRNGGQSIQTR